MPCQLGAVPYWNALPLIHYLPEPPRLAPPAALARLLRLGAVDIATAPIVTLFENPGYQMVPGIGIGCRGPVRSVKLFFKNPETTARNIASIYLDMESRTSALLLKVLLRFKYGRDLDTIRFVHPLPSPNVEGQLLIGDKAMQQLATAPALDLGQEWTEWTGLPFVFAAWIARDGAMSERVTVQLTAARDRGVANLASVIPLQPALPFDLIHSYLSENIRYAVGPEELEGIRRFHDYAAQLGLAGKEVPRTLKVA